jgi:uncharacterized protein (TIGR02757 family)
MDKRESKLREWTDIYETVDYITGDPIWFPHQYNEKRDIEISGFITSWISYGNRKAIVATAGIINDLFEGSPSQYILQRKFGHLRDKGICLYRFYKYSDFYHLCERLYSVYTRFRDMEEAVIAADASRPIQSLQQLFEGIKGVPDLKGKSACKRLAMFLRWMVRQNSVVDFGIWQGLDPADLIIPLDIHVYKQALKLNITNRRTPDMQAALEITDYFKFIYPMDPAKGDFALFGYGVNNKFG